MNNNWFKRLSFSSTIDYQNHATFIPDLLLPNDINASQKYKYIRYNEKLVEKAKAEILGYACIIDRSNGKSNIEKKIVSQIQIEIPTYKGDNLPEHLINTKPYKPGSRNI